MSEQRRSRRNTHKEETRVGKGDPEWIKKVADASGISLQEFREMHDDMFNEETLDDAPKG